MDNVMRAVRRLVVTINNGSDWIGKALCLLVVPMVLILVWEVLVRYGFNAPTIWAHESAAQLFGAFFILGGVYTLRWRAHVNVEVLYNRFPVRVAAIVDLLTWMLFYVFFGLLMWYGGKAAWTAVARMEHSSTIWGPPIWPLKLIIPLASGLMLLEGLTKTISDLYTAVTGRQLTIEAPKKEGHLL